MVSESREGGHIHEKGDLGPWVTAWGAGQGSHPKEVQSHST